MKRVDNVSMYTFELLAMELHNQKNILNYFRLVNKSQEFVFVSFYINIFILKLHQQEILSPICHRLMYAWRIICCQTHKVLRCFFESSIFFHKKKSSIPNICSIERCILCSSSKCYLNELCLKSFPVLGQLQMLT